VLCAPVPDREGDMRTDELQQGRQPQRDFELAVEKKAQRNERRVLVRVKNFGQALQPLNLNTAAQIDLEAAGGLLRREAAAVVRYREQNGRFKTVDDLKKVPGLDFKKIESRRDAVVVM